MSGTGRIVRLGLLTLFVASLSGAVCDRALGADWPQWRGPEHSGVTQEDSGHAKGWPPRKLWTRNVGRGCTSPILAGGKLYVKGWAGRADRRKNSVGTDTVYCIEAATGKELWKQSYTCRFQGRVRMGDTGRYGGPSSTPTIDTSPGGYLYTLSIDGDLRCGDPAAKGRLVWAKNLYDEYKVRRRPSAGGGTRDFGYVGSPVVLGKAVIVEVGSAAGTVIAFDKRTGGRLWASALKGPAGHTGGPVPMTVGGASSLATLTLTRLVVLRADGPQAGKTIGQVDRATDYGCSIATPAVAGSRIVVTSSYNQKNTARVDVSPSGARGTWRVRDCAMVSSPVIHKDRVFMVGGALKCLDLNTGKLLWSGGKFDDGSCLVTADDKVLVFGRGRVALVAALPKDNKYRELAATGKLVNGVCYPHLALSDGILVVKDRDGNMVVSSVRERSEKVK